MKLFAAREEDAHQGWVWLQDATLPARSVVKIENLETGMSVYCEALQIDDNFLQQYNQPPRISIAEATGSLVIGAWYRIGLGGLKSQAEVNLRVSQCNSWWGQFKACTSHPQIVVRLAVWLGGIGLLLGAVSVVLAVVSIWPIKT